MRARKPLLGIAVLLVVAVTGCAGGSDQGHTADTSMRAGGIPASGVSMRERMKTDPGMPMGRRGSAGHEGAASGAGPSAAARMVCSEEIRRDVAHALGLASVPAGRVTWSPPLYTCRFDVPGGVLLLKVADSQSPLAGKAFFEKLRRSLGEPRELGGLESFGLPGFETSSGVVAFLKDGKTLEVDATGLARSSGRGMTSRAAVAYGLAADVVACWSE